MSRITSSIQFYCRKCKTDKQGLAPIEVSICINGKRLFANLPRKEFPEVFKKATQTKRGTELKTYLEEIRSRLYSYQSELLHNDIPITSATIRDCLRNGGIRSITIKDLTTSYLTTQKKRVGISLTQSAYRKYELTADLLLSHLNPEREASTITPADIQDFYIDLQSKYNTSTSASYIAKAKTIIQYGIDNGIIKINPFQNLKVQRPKHTIDYLNDEEIRKIRETPIENESLNNVRNAFLMQVYSGLSYIDLEHLNKEDIKIDPNTNTHYISKERIKTGITYTSIILPEGVEMLKENNYNLHIISNQKTNIYLKQIMVLCGIKHPLTTHLGRKTYGHILLNKGVRIETVAKALGHSTARTTARYYAELTPETTIQEITSAFSS